jgi:hypothetical protein
MIPLNKIMHMPADLKRFGGIALAPLVQHRDLLDGQHEARRWEYGMALEAIGRWWLGQPDYTTRDPLQILDAGGASSNFWKALTEFTSEPILRVDPLFVGQHAIGQQAMFVGDLAQFAGGWSRALDQMDIITSISVIEHIRDVAAPGTKTPLTLFLEAAHRILCPGGLLVLTTDYWNAEGPDTAHFHWMRERIYNPDSLRRLEARCHKIGFTTFGGVDRTWHGPQLYDYAMASLVLTKELRG